MAWSCVPQCNISKSIKFSLSLKRQILQALNKVQEEIWLEDDDKEYTK
jgi:hypothetical protein